MESKRKNKLVLFCIVITILCVILLGIDCVLSDSILVKICFAVAVVISLVGLCFSLSKNRKVN